MTRSSHADAQTPPRSHEHHAGKQMNHYNRLLAMTALSFVAMYALMYAMVDSLGNVLNSINQVYMAGLMAAAMVIIELAIMGAMYHRRALNRVIMAASVVALVGFWLLIRTQGGVGDIQFLRSMVPHHSGAILMCEKAAIADADIQQLCKTIIASQADEIAQMRAKLDQLER
jgi:uncharacterized protein (DUF305 family)